MPGLLMGLMASGGLLYTTGVVFYEAEENAVLKRHLAWVCCRCICLLFAAGWLAVNGYQIPCIKPLALLTT